MRNTTTPSTENTSKLSLLRHDTRGLSTVEYIILLALIAVAGIATWEKVGTAITGEAKQATQKIKSL